MARTCLKRKNLTNDFLTFSGKSDLHNCFRVYRDAELHIRFHIFRNEMHGMVISRSTESDDLHICSHVSGNDGLHLGLHIFRKVTICICVFQFSKKKTSVKNTITQKLTQKSSFS